MRPLRSAADDFDGVHDALMHPYTADGSRYMHYITDHGWYHELPLEEIFAAARAQYGNDLIGPDADNSHHTADTFTR